MRHTIIILILAAAGQSSAAPGSSRERKRDAFSELNAKRGQSGRDAGLALRFFDAISGQPIRGASIEFEGKRVLTGTDGRALFPWPIGISRREDRRKATVSRRGYVTSTVEVHFLAGSIFNNRFSISPALAPRQLRVVLDWRSAPADLDAHLTKKGAFHISYRNMKAWRDLVRLDRDDLDGFGPETITIDRIDLRGTYVFRVHDYTHRSSPASANFRRAGATVTVFADGKVAGQFIAAPGSGNLWTVFKIRDGKVMPINAIESR